MPTACVPTSRHTLEPMHRKSVPLRSNEPKVCRQSRAKVLIPKQPEGNLNPGRLPIPPLSRACKLRRTLLQARPESGRSSCCLTRRRATHCLSPPGLQCAPTGRAGCNPGSIMPVWTTVGRRTSACALAAGCTGRTWAATGSLRTTVVARAAMSARCSAAGSWAGAAVAAPAHAASTSADKVMDFMAGRLSLCAVGAETSVKRDRVARSVRWNAA